MKVAILSNVAAWPILRETSTITLFCDVHIEYRILDLYVTH